MFSDGTAAADSLCFQGSGCVWNGKHSLEFLIASGWFFTDQLPIQEKLDLFRTGIYFHLQVFAFSSRPGPRGKGGIGCPTNGNDLFPFRFRQTHRRIHAIASVPYDFAIVRLWLAKAG